MLFNILFTYPKCKNQNLALKKRPRVMKQYSSMLQYILFHAAPDRGRGAQFLPYLSEFLHWNSLEYSVGKLMEILMDSK